MSFDAFWLPSLPSGISLVSRDLGQNKTLRYPELTSVQVRHCCTNLLAASSHARALPLSGRVSAIADAAALLMDPKGALLGQALQLIPLTTGYSPEMTRYVLERMARDWSKPALEKLLSAEFADPAQLDRPVSEPGTQRRSAAFGPRLAAHIFSGNVPGVAVNSLIRTLLVKAPSFGKTAADEPILPVLFARALHQVNPRLAATLAITYWPGGSEQAEAELFQAADTLIVYGSAGTVESVRQRVPPESHVVVHGPRLSLGLVNASALDTGRLAAVAADAALAVAVFDQQGCVSPHAVYVLGSVDQANQFARLTADALERLQTQMPRGRISPAEASAIQDSRARAEFRAIAGASVTVFAGAGASFTVISDSDPAFELSCLNRLLYVKPLENLDQLPALLGGLDPFLQSIAVAGFTDLDQDRIVGLLGPLGVVRVTSFSALPWPPAHWHHDGRGPLRELVRWVDLEI